jgi:hypothetical protein
MQRSDQDVKKNLLTIVQKLIHHPSSQIKLRSKGHDLNEVVRERSDNHYLLLLQVAVHLPEIMLD